MMASLEALGDLTSIACDDTGRLFAAVQQPDGSTKVLVTDVFAAVLAASHDAQSIPLDPRSLDALTILHPSPPLRQRITSMAASPDGHHLLLLGTEQQQDTPLVMLLDVYGAEPDFEATAAAASSAAAEGSSQQQQHQVASCVRVHSSLYKQRPGLRVLQAAWHPLSRNHFALLASDNAWRLYAASAPGAAEQELLLRPAHAPPPGKLGLRLRYSSRAVRITRFAWGPPHAGGWAPYCVLFVAGGGGVYSVCPVVPFGLRVAGASLQQLLEGHDVGIDPRRSWLQEAFPEAVPQAEEQRRRQMFVCRPHMTETSAPALLGPLKGRQGQPSLGRGVAALSCALSQDAAASGAAVAATGEAAAAALLVGFSDGTLLAYALHPQQLQPCWCPSLPQCVYDSRGDVAAVRYECDAAPLPASQEVAPGQEDWGVAPAGPLLLLDRLSLQLHPAPEGMEEDEREDGAGWLQQGGGEDDSSSDADSIESDAAYDPDAGSQQPSSAAAAASSRQQQALSAPGATSAVPLLHLLQLLPSPDAPGKFWAVHDQGAWGLSLPWLGAVSRQLLGQEEEAGSGDGLGAPPAPSLHELLLASSHIMSTAVAASPLLGGGALVLEAGGQGLTFLRLRGAPSSTTAAAAAGVSSPAAAAAAAAGGGSSGVSAADAVQAELAALGVGGSEQAEAARQVEDFYAEVRAGPRRLPPLASPPAAEGAEGPDEVAAAVGRLSEGIAHAHGKYDEYIPMAYQALLHRASQLKEEIGHQKAVLVGLQGYAAALAARSKEVGGYVGDLAARQANLGQRLALLQQMHWALPRPPSEAEVALVEQLAVWEGQQRELKATFEQLQGRLSALPARAPPSTPSAAAGGPPGSAAKRFPLTPTSTHNGPTPARRPGVPGFFMSAKASPLLMGGGVRRHTPGGTATTPVTFSAAAAVAGGSSRGTPGGGLLGTPGSATAAAAAADAGVARVRGALEQLLGLVVRSKASLAELEAEVESYKAEAVLRQQVPAGQP